MDENRRLSALEQLEKEFESSKSKSKESKKAKRPTRRRPVMDRKKVYILAIILFVAVVTIMIAVIVVGNKESNSDDIRSNYPSFITKEEKEDWKNKSVDKGQIYVYVNTSLEVKADGKSVALRLANPPYCAYPLKIKLSLDENKEAFLYQSDLLEPGDSVEMAELTGIPEKKGVYNTTIYYTFYDEKGETVVGEHEVNATINIPEDHTQEQEKETGQLTEETNQQTE